MLVDVPGIPLRRRDGTVLYALVDPEDFVAINEWRWCVIVDGDRRYAYRNGTDADGSRCSIYMAREIMGLERDLDFVVDHINRNTLDNRKANLRVISRLRNAQNVPSKGGTSRFRGVYWHSRSQRWVAQCHWQRRNYWLGFHDTEEEAAAAASEFRAQHMECAVEEAAA